MCSSLSLPYVHVQFMLMLSLHPLFIVISMHFVFYQYCFVGLLWEVNNDVCQIKCYNLYIMTATPIGHCLVLMLFSKLSVLVLITIYRNFLNVKSGLSNTISQHNAFFCLFQNYEKQVVNGKIYILGFVPHITNGYFIICVLDRNKTYQDSMLETLNLKPKLLYPGHKNVPNHQVDI